MFLVEERNRDGLKTKYSGTPPYDHPVYKTTSLLRSYSFKPNVKTIESFYYFEDPVNATTSLLRPGFYGPTVVALTGFHCIAISERIDCSWHLHIIMKYAYGLPFSLDTVQDQEHECKINCGTK